MMENITQKDIDLIIEAATKNPNYGKEVSIATKKLKDVDPIGALYVLNYLNAIETLRKKSLVVDEDSKIDGMKKPDFDTFKALLDQNYQLELNYLIDTDEKFKGMCWLLSHALDRKNLICDFDDAVHPKETEGRCEYEDHSETIVISDILSDEDMDVFNKINEEKGFNEAFQTFEDKLNPVTTVYLTYSYDDDNHKMDKKYPEYLCKKCMDYCNENSDGYVSCDMEIE